MKIEGLLSTEEPDPQQDPHFENKKLERFPLGPDFPDRKVVKTDHARAGEKIVSLTDMAEVDEKIQQLMEKRNGRHHCKACDYSTTRSCNIKEHAERHIDGLSYPCQLCEKTFRSVQTKFTHASSLSSKIIF